jgi:AcrR family transcriptional regulator
MLPTASAVESAAPQPRVRLTQEQRRTRTRHLLLEATIACLEQLGCAGTTTLEVERRAGVSRGARIHHFPSKAALLAEAVDYLYEQLSAHYAEAFARAEPKQSVRQRLRAGLHMLWGVYQRPAYTAVIELSKVARSDAELKERLRAVAQRHRELALQAATAYFPELPRERARACIESIHASFVGLRVQGDVTADREHSELVLGGLEDLVLSYLKNPRSEE